MSAPSPDDVRNTLSQLDERGRKVVAGVFGLMIRSPERVRDREWVSQQLADVALVGLEAEVDSPDEAVTAVQELLRAEAPIFLQASFLLFQRVGLDLAPRAEAGFTFEEAMETALGYLVEE